MKLELCKTDDKNKEMYLVAAQSQGYNISFEKGSYFIFIQNEPSYIRNAEFKSIPSAVYEFKKEKSE